jgi:hypothetical protein
MQATFVLLAPTLFRSKINERDESKRRLRLLNTDGKNLANSGEDAFLLNREHAVRVNVWTPEINGSGRRPVMVYVHGGGFSSGSGHDLLSSDGESPAHNHDVVLGNHNHRLHVYGYLNLETLGGDEFAVSANAGCKEFSGWDLRGYAANDLSIFRLTWSYLSVTRDRAFLDERIADQTVLQRLQTRN